MPKGKPASGQRKIDPAHKPGRKPIIPGSPLKTRCWKLSDSEAEEVKALVTQIQERRPQKPS